jgi:hypothetical protein
LDYLNFEEILEKGSDLDSIVAKLFQHAHVGKEGQEILPKKYLGKYQKQPKGQNIGSVWKQGGTNKVQFPVTQVSYCFHNHSRRPGRLAKADFLLIKKSLGLFFDPFIFQT